MGPNLNAGYGALVAAALTAQTTGKTFLVAKAAQVNKDRLNDLFDYDYDGTPRIFATITEALAQCVANRGDVIYVAAGYTETITTAGGLALSKAGVKIIGLGEGSLRPTITMGAAAATVAVSAANVTVENILFVANFADVATCFILTVAPGFTLKGCEFRDTSSILNFLAILTTTVSVDANDLSIIGNRIFMDGTTAATTPIKIAGTIARVKINDNFVVKAILNNTSCLLAHGALVVTKLEMARNRVVSANTDSATGALLITTSSTTNTGMVYDNYVQSADVAGALLVTAGSIYGMIENYHIGDADGSAIILPAAGAN